MSSLRELVCTTYTSSWQAEWNSTLPKVPECDIFLTFPLILLSFAALVVVPHLVAIFNSQSLSCRRVRSLFIGKCIFIVLSLAANLGQIVKKVEYLNEEFLDLLYPCIFIFSLIILLMVLNYERKRDAPNSGPSFLCFLLMAITAFCRSWWHIATSLITQSPDHRNKTSFDPDVLISRTYDDVAIGIDHFHLAACLCCLVLACWSERTASARATKPASLPASVAAIHTFAGEDNECQLCTCLCCGCWRGNASDRITSNEAADVSHSQTRPPKAISPSLDDTNLTLVSSGEFSVEEVATKGSSRDLNQMPSPESYASFLSRLTFVWFTHLVVSGFKKPLKMVDLWTLDDRYKAGNLSAVFLRNLDRFFHPLRKSSDPRCRLSSLSGGLLDGHGPRSSNASLGTSISRRESSRSYPGGRWRENSNTSNVLLPAVDIVDGNSRLLAMESASGIGTSAPYSGAIARSSLQSRRPSKQLPEQITTSALALPSTVTDELSIAEDGLASTKRLSVRIKEGSRPACLPGTSDSPTDLPSVAIRDSENAGGEGKPMQPHTSTKDATRRFSGPAQQDQLPDAEPKIDGGLVRIIWITYWRSMVCAFFYKLAHDLALFGGPLLLKCLLIFIQEKDKEPVWHGYFYALSMLIVASLQSLVLHQYFLIQNVLGMKIRAVLTAAVYRKSLVLSPAAKRQSTTGEITNLMSTDAQRFMMLMPYVNILWSGPLQIVVAMYLLWMELGPSVLAGVSVLLLLIPVNAFIARFSKTLQEKQLTFSDTRLKLVNDLLNGIRVLKLYAWECSFIAQVCQIRQKELSYLRKHAYVSGLNSFIFNCAPVMVALSTFATYVLVSADNILDAQKAFVALSLFNILRFPLFMFPMTLSNLVQAYVSIQRLTRFLMLSELDPNDVTHEDTPGVAAVIEHGTFSWSSDLEPVLNNISIHFSEGQSTAIIGIVGSGKSSLIHALLGNMERLTGRVNMKGRVAYVPQTAWILNATLRDNILFGRPYDAVFYDKVLTSCALQPDMEILPDGDLTEIGDKGINLSGGQKQRVSLARACYSQADIYLLDDPLSAVDAHVASQLLGAVLGRQGLLAEKTRIMTTNTQSALSHCDRLVLLEEGRICEWGTTAHLLSSHHPMSHRLTAFLATSAATASPEKDEGAQPNAKDSEREQLPRRRLRHQGSNVSASEYSRSLRSANARRRLNSDTAKCDGLLEDEYDFTNLEQDITAELDESIVSGYAPPSVALLSRSSSISSRGQQNVRRHRSSSTPAVTVNASGKEAKVATATEEEMSATGGVKCDVIFAYLKSVGAFFCIATLLLFIVNNAASLGSNLWLVAWSGDAKNSQNLTDRLLSARRKSTSLPSELETEWSDANKLRDWRLIVYGLLGLTQAIAALVAYTLFAIGHTRSAKVLHLNLLNSIMRVPISFFDTTPQGRVVNRFSQDVSALDTQLSYAVLSSTSTFLQCIVTVGLTAALNPWMILPIVILTVFYVGMQKIFVTTSRQLKRINSVSRSPIFSHFSETLSGVESIRAYGLCASFAQTNDERVDVNDAAVYASVIANRWLAIHLESVGNLLIVVVAVAAVAARDEMSAGFAGLVVSYVLNLTQALNWLVRMTADLEANIVCVERIKEYSELTPEAEWEIASTKPAAHWPQGRIEFIGYSTRYRPGHDLVLRSITFSVHQGEKLGIVGRTGSGKSSLVLGLFRMLEATEGQILIDGVDISTLGLHELRGKLTLIPQDPVLFCGTLRVNLDPFSKHSDSELWRAVELAHLSTLLKEVAAEAGLDMEISEGGANISQGQRQLICLARALLRRSRILVLDEATAAVDPQTDLLIQETVRAEFSASTVLTIAHRLNTIIDYDRVMVLSSGQVLELDSPQRLLLQKNSAFYALALEAKLVNPI